jgi:hypothetical protein
MSEALKEKVQDPTEWGTYFKTEIKMSKIRRGIDMMLKYSADEIRILIGEMVLECQKPPFNQIDKVVLQRVISDGAISDPKFYGFTVAWVRGLLNSWWYLSGYKHFEKLLREKEAQEENNKPVPTVNPHEDVHQTVSNYVKSLLLEGAKLKTVPKMTEQEKKIKGAEWTSNLEHKGTYHNNGLTVEQYVMRECVLKAASTLYSQKQTFKLNPFKVEGYGEEIYCESQTDADIIYNDAKEMYPAALQQFLKK